MPEEEETWVEVARISAQASEADLRRFVAVVEQIFGPDLAATGDGSWVTIFIAA